MGVRALDHRVIRLEMGGKAEEIHECKVVERVVWVLFNCGLERSIWMAIKLEIFPGSLQVKFFRTGHQI